MAYSLGLISSKAMRSVGVFRLSIFKCGFYNKCRNSSMLVGKVSLSISRQAHQFNIFLTFCNK